MSQKIVPGLNHRQMQVLREGTPSAVDILGTPDQPGLLSDLNEEIVDEVEAQGLELPEMPEQLLPEPSVEKEMAVPDLDAELDAMIAKANQDLAKREAEAEAVEEETQTESDSPEEMMRGRIIEMLKTQDGAPTDKHIAAWKAKHGPNGVNVIALGEGDVYVFTYLRRAQHKKLLEAIQKGTEAGHITNPDEAMMEKVLQYCVLWPRPLSIEFLYNSRAGVVQTLYSTIMLHSYFLTTEQAMVLTTQL